MYTQKLSNLIIGNLKFLGFDESFYQNGMNILQYFLEKNICSLFGKDEFDFDELSQSQELEISKITDINDNSIKFIFPNKKYEIKKFNDTLVILDENKVLVAKINMISDEIYQNILINGYNDTFIFETQKVNVKDKKFEYAKKVKSFGEIDKNYVLSLRALGTKKNDVENFEVHEIQPENEKTNFWKKLFSTTIVGIQTSYKTDDILNHLNNIFSYAEEKCENYNKKLVLKK